MGPTPEKHWEIDVAEPLTYAQANPLQKSLRRFAASRPGAWLFAGILHHIDEPVYRLSRGRHTFASLLSGLPVVMLTTTGARSGVRRSAPVLGVPTEYGLVVIASSWGQERHPAWYYNLRANPEGEVSVDRTTQRFRATEAQGDQRERIWQQAVRIYPGWSTYERRAPHRRIPVLVLDPV